ncbi:MAG: hypothetical protein WCG73_00745 [Candidatus Moraniibacteriota bacterium]
MDDSFDTSLAAERHSKILREVERIRDGLSADVINYYRNSPTSENEEKEQQRGMRKYLEIAQDEIRNVLQDRLN